MADHRPLSITGVVPSGADTGAVRVVLVIGRADDAALAQAGVVGGRMVVAPFSALDETLLRRVEPETVIFPLIATGFDALHVIERLAALNFAGAACVMAPILPNRRIVEAELRSHGPGLRLILIERPGVS
jgi:hypothetical protein